MILFSRNIEKGIHIYEIVTIFVSTLGFLSLAHACMQDGKKRIKKNDAYLPHQNNRSKIYRIFLKIERKLDHQTYLDLRHQNEHYKELRASGLIC